MWYRTGTVSLESGSRTVTGAGTNWIGQHQGWVLVAEQGGTLHEISAVISSTELELAEAHAGDTAADLGYFIIPTHSLNADLIEKINTLLSEVATARTEWDAVYADFTRTAFAVWQEQPGNEGLSVADFITAITGPQGAQGVQGEKGDTGDQGPQGIQGDKGDKGDTGDQGLQGVQGVQGEKGDTGDQGPQGIQGDKGDKGDTGDQGPQGIQGEKGDKGDTGQKGDTGDKGDKGDTGHGFVVLGALTATSDLPVSAVPGNAYSIGGDIWTWNPETNAFDNIGPLEGPKGDVGDTGATGPGAFNDWAALPENAGKSFQDFLNELSDGAVALAAGHAEAAQEAKEAAETASDGIGDVLSQVSDLRNQTQQASEVAVSSAAALADAADALEAIRKQRLRALVGLDF